MARRVVVEAPASSANLGPGFDVFALALAEPMDRLVVEKAEKGISLAVDNAPELLRMPMRNVVGAVARRIMTDHRVRGGVSMSLTKGVPVGAGLGSSAASSVAAAVGVDALFRLGLPSSEIIRYAGIGEKLASGTAHYDNVTASYAGGFVIVNGSSGYVRIEAPRSLALCLVTPRLKLPEQKTKYARSILPRDIPLRTAVEVERAASMMTHGFMTGDVEEIGRAMLVSPVDEARSKMIPGFKAAREAALAGGAAGVCISGAGPTVLAASSKRKSKEVLRAMERAFLSRGIQSDGFVTKAGRGCRVVEG
ncbi:MAG: homoserine kinase [Nitrososphaerota archaeon]|nr:homoserine kinase [Nitrososphaerota archaeon]